MTLFLISTLKASIVLAVAFAAVRLMRKQSAALRHMILAAAVFSAAAAPLLSRITPHRVITVGIPWAPALLRATTPAVSPPAAEPIALPSDSIAEPEPSSDFASSAEPIDTTKTPETPVEIGAGQPQGNAEAKPPRAASHSKPVRTVSAASSVWATITSDPERILVYVWLAGVAALLFPLFVGLVRLRLIERQSRNVRSEAWEKALAGAAAHYGLRRSVRLIQSSEPLALVTWGVWRPVLCIPTGAEEWTEQRIRVVVFHELAHVRRGDWIWQILTECARTIYWFNPLFWIACGSLAQESEQAADDAALRVGIPELDYANELLALARTLIAPLRTSSTLPSMARSSTIERRFKAILDPRRKRNAASGLSTALAGTLFVTVTAALVALHFALPAIATAAAKTIAPVVLPLLSMEPVQPAPAAEEIQAAEEAPTPDRPFIRIHRLAIKSSGPIRIEKSRDAIEAFRSLGGVGRFQVYFHRTFQSSPLPENFILTGADPYEALEALCRETKSFWEAYDSTTILVGTDNPTVRKEVEAQVLTTVYLDAPADEAKLTEIGNTVREQISPTPSVTSTTPNRPFVVATTTGGQIAPSPAATAPFGNSGNSAVRSAALVATNTAANAVLLRTTPEKAVLAEQTIRGGKAESAQATAPNRGTNSILTDFAGNTFALEAGHLRRIIARAHAQLSPANSPRITATLQGTSRELFQTLADRAGIEVIFHRQFPNQPHADVTFVDTDIYKALDLLSFETGNFWQALGPQKIVVAPDNATVRRDVEVNLLQPVSLTDVTGPETTEMVTALRTLLSFNQIAVLPSARTMILRDSADKVALAAALLTPLHRFGASGSPLIQSPLPPAIPSGVFAQPTDPDVIHSARLKLEMKSNGPVSVEKPTSREAYEALANFAGIKVLFHRQFPTARIAFTVKGQNVFEALDTLSFVTGSFWIVLDAHTILVATDNPTVRRDVEPMRIKTVYLRPTEQRDVTAVVTTLRTILSFNQIALSTHAGALVLRDTEDKIGLGERIIALANVASPGAPQAAPLPAAGLSNSGIFATPTDPERHNRLRSQLQLKLTLPGPIQLRGSSQELFESLADRGGLRVIFDPRFANMNSTSLDLDSSDLLTALDRLSFVTGNFWQVVDPQTIRVATDNPTLRRELEPILTKTIDLQHVQTPQTILEIVTTIRTLLSTREIAPLSHGIQMSDTADRIAIAEWIIATLDIPPRQVSQ